MTMTDRHTHLFYLLHKFTHPHVCVSVDKAQGRAVSASLCRYFIILLELLQKRCWGTQGTCNIMAVYNTT